MRKPSAEQFAQRVFHLGLLDAPQLDSVWAEFRRRDIPLEQFTNFVLRRELLTNYQIEKVIRGEMSGFFYGDYKVLYLVGSGSFARVYRGVHKNTGEVRAVKVLRRRYGEDPVQTEQFVREGRMGMSLRHPNIVPIYEVHSQKGSHWIVMEFVEGRNLRDFVRIRQKLSALEATRLIKDVVAGLAHAFQQNVTHRDLKMSNVLVASTGTAKLVDFGLAARSGRLTDDVLANHPNPRTIDYAGLERCTGVRKDDPRSDIYFAGTIYYHMLTGQPALYETKDRIQRLSISRFQEIVPINHLAPWLPSPVVMIVNKSMELNPERRYQSPQEMLVDLNALERRLAAEMVVASETPSSGAAASSAPKLEGADHTLMIVESDVEMQDLLRARLKKYGYRVLVISDTERAIGRFGAPEDHPAQCVLFSSKQLGEEAVDAFNRFGRAKHTAMRPAVLLLAEGHERWAERAETARHRVVVQMPIKLIELRQILKRLATAGAARR